MMDETYYTDGSGYSDNSSAIVSVAVGLGGLILAAGLWFWMEVNASFDRVEQVADQAGIPEETLPYRVPARDTFEVLLEDRLVDCRIANDGDIALLCDTAGDGVFRLIEDGRPANNPDWEADR